MKPKTTLRQFLLAAGSSLLAIAVGSASAATLQWDGGAGTGNWQTPANWNPNTANLDFNGTYLHRLNVNGAQALIYTSAEGITNYGTTDVRGLVVGSGSSGTMTITGGTFSGFNGTITDVIGNGDNSTGILNIAGGTYIGSQAGTDLGVGIGPGRVSTLNVDSGLATITLLRAHSGNATLNLNGGELQVNNISQLNDFGGSNFTINFNGGTLKARQDNLAFVSIISNNVFVKSGGAKVDTNNFNVTITNNLLDGTGGGGLTKQGAGTLTLSGNNTYTGGTTLSAGTLTMGNAGALGSTSGQLTVNGGTLNMAGNNLTVGNLTGSGGIISGTSAATRTLTIGQGNFGGGDFQGQINNGAGGTTALTKTGTGTITLSGANGYTGATNVNAGTLVINGSTSSTSLVTVGVNGTLGGTGTVGGNTTISGTHSPGNSPGIQTFTGNLSYVDAGTPDPTVNWELANNTTTLGINPTANFDQIIVGGNLDFTNITAINLSFNGAGSGVLWSNVFWDSNRSWTLYDVAGTTSNFNNLSLNTINWLDSGSNLFSTTGGSFSLSQSGQDVLLNYTAVPEPGAALLGGLGMLMLLRRRR